MSAFSEKPAGRVRCDSARPDRCPWRASESKPRMCPSTFRCAGYKGSLQRPLSTNRPLAAHALHKPGFVSGPRELALLCTMNFRIKQRTEELVCAHSQGNQRIVPRMLAPLKRHATSKTPPCWSHGASSSALKTNMRLPSNTIVAHPESCVKAHL